MSKSIDFYFDFSSPYSYLSAARIDAFLDDRGATANWRPILLGAVFKVTGQPLLVDVPMLGPYSLRDMERSARRHRIAFCMPETFPLATMSAARAFYAYDKSDTTASHAFARAVMAAYFAEGRDIANLEVLADIATGCGLDTTSLAERISDPQIKLHLRTQTETAIARGVCGAPFLFIGDEPFWGNDRLDEALDWLDSGGW